MLKTCLLFIFLSVIIVSSKKFGVSSCSCPEQTDCDIISEAYDVIIGDIVSRTKVSIRVLVRSSFKNQFKVGSAITVSFDPSCTRVKPYGSYLMSVVLKNNSPFLDDCGFLLTSTQISSDLQTTLSNIDTSCPKKCTDDGGLLRSDGETWAETPCMHCMCSNGVLSCAIMDCAAPMCDDYVVPEGACCPVCSPHVSVECDAVRCASCEHPIWMEDECCCKEACVPQKCDLECPGGFRYDDFGCPLCECLVCPKIACFLPPCDNPVEFPGTCCPSCPADCTGVECPALEDCYEWYIPANKCCPVCLVPESCLDVVCPPLSCDSTFQVPGECCKSCTSE